MNNGNQSNFKNTLTAIILSVAVLLAWDYFMVPKVDPVTQAQQQDKVTTLPSDTNIPTASNDIANTPSDQNLTPAGGFEILENAIEKNKRLKIQNNQLIGSLNLDNGRFDDLRLVNYTEELTDTDQQKNIRLFAPGNTDAGFFADFGYNIGNMPLSKFDGAWSSVNNMLANGQPVILTKKAGDLTIERHIMLDDHYMFTVKDILKNKSAENISVTPYALLKKNKPAYLSDSNEYVVHTGFIGWIENALEELSFADIKDNQKTNLVSHQAGWVGLTEKYWMATIIPSQEKMTARALYNPYAGHDSYQADYVTATQSVPAGGELILENRLFAGAKSVQIIEKYNEVDGIKGFDYTVDWGWFWFFTKPIFKGLLYIYGIVGNYGIAILVLTLLIKALFFPLANKSYVAMSKMKKLQPLMEDIKSKYGSDPMKQQQELVALYKKEKVNPVAGCWPLLLQIPVFYALYKVLSVALELRHAPFFGWIQDLSIKDPTSIWNIFGLLPYDPSLYVPSFINIGILPILMGITMWMQQRLNPAPTDPVQARVMGFFPLIFTFVLAPFAAGLVLYWTWNNILSVMQQAVIMKRMGTPIEFRLWSKKPDHIPAPANVNKKK